VLVGSRGQEVSCYTTVGVVLLKDKRTSLK